MWIAGWEVAPEQCWYTSDWRVISAPVEDGMWDVRAVSSADYQLLQESGLHSELFPNARVATRAAHEVLGSSLQLTRAEFGYAIVGTRWRVERVSRTQWQLLAHGRFSADNELYRKLRDYRTSTLRAAVEHFAEVADELRTVLQHRRDQILDTTGWATVAVCQVL